MEMAGNHVTSHEITWFAVPIPGKVRIWKIIVVVVVVVVEIAVNEISH